MAWAPTNAAPARERDERGRKKEKPTLWRNSKTSGRGCTYTICDVMRKKGGTNTDIGFLTMFVRLFQQHFPEYKDQVRECCLDAVHWFGPGTQHENDERMIPIYKILGTYGRSLTLTDIFDGLYEKRLFIRSSQFYIEWADGHLAEGNLSGANLVLERAYLALGSDHTAFAALPPKLRQWREEHPGEVAQARAEVASSDLAKEMAAQIAHEARQHRSGLRITAPDAVLTDLNANVLKQYAAPRAEQSKEWNPHAAPFMPRRLAHSSTMPSMPSMPAAPPRPPPLFPRVGASPSLGVSNGLGVSASSSHLAEYSRQIREKNEALFGGGSVLRSASILPAASCEPEQQQPQWILPISKLKEENTYNAAPTYSLFGGGRGGAALKNKKNKGDEESPDTTPVKANILGTSTRHNIGGNGNRGNINNCKQQTPLQQPTSFEQYFQMLKF